MPHERQVNLLGRHAGAVVAHADELPPGVLQVHGYGGGAGVDGVLDQLLDHRGRALDHFAGRDLIDQGVITSYSIHYTKLYDIPRPFQINLSAAQAMPQQIV